MTANIPDEAEELKPILFSYCGSRTNAGHGETEICGEITYGGAKYHCGNCARKDLNAALVREARLLRIEHKALQRIASLHHVGMELMGVIEEFRAVPCDSLMRRMFDTSKRYAPRLLCKCQTCYDRGFVMGDFDEESERFARMDCPDCDVRTNASYNAHCLHCGIVHTIEETCAAARARVGSLTK